MEVFSKRKGTWQK